MSQFQDSRIPTIFEKMYSYSSFFNVIIFVFSGPNIKRIQIQRDIDISQGIIRIQLMIYFFECSISELPWSLKKSLPMCIHAVCRKHSGQNSDWLALPINCKTPSINANQCRSKSWQWSKTLLNANQCWSIYRNWLEMIDIGINARILIGIDRHWALIEGVLLIIGII